MTKTHLDQVRISEILARLDAASAGPWMASLEGRHQVSGSSCLVTQSGAIDFAGATDGDIEFMANARQDIPYLVEELRRLAELIGQ